jgi:hypothetical protein
VGLADPSKVASPELLQQFVETINRDVMGLISYYNQQLQDYSLGRCFFLGSDLLKDLFPKHPVTGSDERLQFGLSKPQVLGLDAATAGKVLHITGALFLGRDYNLIDPHIILDRQVDNGYRLLLLGIGAMIVAALIFVLAGKIFNPMGPKALATFYQKRTALQVSYDELHQQEEELHRLKQFQGWDEYYQRTYKSQPAWDKLFVALANALPPVMVIQDFHLTPVQKNGKSIFRCIISGHMNVDTWQHGLEHIRKFGGFIHQSPYFEYENLSYSPEEQLGGEDGKSRFDFEFTLLLEPKRESK